MKFIGYKFFFIDYLNWRYGVSLGMHVDKWRIDLHILCWIVSFGQIPIYLNAYNKPFASSRSYHEGQRRKGEYIRPRR